MTRISLDELTQLTTEAVHLQQTADNAKNEYQVAVERLDRILGYGESYQAVYNAQRLIGQAITRGDTFIETKGKGFDGPND